LIEAVPSGFFFNTRERLQYPIPARRIKIRITMAQRVPFFMDAHSPFSRSSDV
jgi:hypothetical protein